MFLSILKLWNFRKFGPNDFSQKDKKPTLSLNFHSGLNVIVGENDAGKSAIIDAIKLVLKTHSYEYIRVESNDFYQDATRFRIEIVFEGLQPEEAKNFTEWLGWIGTGASATPFLRLVLDVQRRGVVILPYETKAGVDDDCYPLSAEAKALLQTTYLKPLRDAESELIARKNSRLSQILLGDIAFKDASNHELVEVFARFNNDLKGYFANEANDHAGAKIKKKIDSYIREFHDNTSEVDFRTAEGQIKGILEKLTLTLKDDLNPGLGSLNRLCMAAELLHLNKENWTGLRLGLIEEVEAHLHPQAQMQVIEMLQGIKQIQLILTTHSPNLASKVKLNNLILCENKYAFPMGKDFTKLRETDYPFLERFLDVTKANLFFARGVILVEGVAEELILPALARKMCELKLLHKDLTAGKVSIVAIQNTAFNRYASIFKRERHPYLKMPVAVINDLDLRPTEYAVRYSIPKNKERFEKIVTAYKQDEYISDKEQKVKGQNVRAFISKFWTLEYCLAMHFHLRKLLYVAIQHAAEENRADNYSGIKSSKMQIRDISVSSINKKWEAFSRGKTDTQLAFDLMYYFIIDKKKLSKAVIAHHFAEQLENDKQLTEEQLDVTDNPIGYLFDAIKYATNN
jgi:putative ATP-dependent endonuclease of OLD family